MPLLKIPFDRGLFYRPETSGVVPDNYLPEILNLTIDTEGVLRKRYNIEETVYQTNTLNAGASLTYPGGIDNLNPLVLGTGPTALAAAIWFNSYDSGGQKLVALNKVGGATADVASFAFNYTRPSFTEYNSIVYASTVNAGVRKVTVLNFATSAITEAAIASSPNLVGIMSFKNRLFGWNGNRVYFTDVPSAGGLPETWNTGANIFDITSSRGTPVIMNVLPVENRLYFFTDSGLFSVLISGPASTWVQRTVDESIRVRDKFSCFVHKNIMYFVDDQSIWATDGVNFSNIGDPVKTFLDDVVSVNMKRRFRLFMFNNRLIFCVRLKDTTNPTAVTYIFTSEMNDVRWTMLSFPGAAGRTFSEIHGTLNDIGTRDYAGSPQSLIFMSFTDASASNKEQTRVYRAPKGEAGDYDSILGAVGPFGVQLSLPLMDFGDALKYKRLNYMLMEIESPLLYTGSSNPLVTVAFASYYVDEASVSNPGMNVSFASPGQYSKAMVKFIGPEIAFRWIRISSAFTVPVNIKAIYLDVDTEGPIEPSTYTVPV